MVSQVRFECGTPLHVGESRSYVGIEAIVERQTLRAFVVTVEHDESAEAADIVQRARQVLRDVEILVAIGAGAEPGSHSPTLNGAEWKESLFGSMAEWDSHPIRFLEHMPAADLVVRLRDDATLKRQAEFLIDSRRASHWATRISLSYQILELEQQRGNGYRSPDWCRHLRNSVSHPLLNDPEVREYLERSLGAASVDFDDPIHRKFLRDECLKLRKQAADVIDSHLLDSKFWAVAGST